MNIVYNLEHTDYATEPSGDLENASIDISFSKDNENKMEHSQSLNLN